MGMIYLMEPKVRQGGYIPFFVTERKRSEAMLVQVVQEAFVQGVSTRKMEKLAHSLGIENLSRSQVSEVTKGLNEQVEEFRNHSLADTVYPVLWVDVLCEKSSCRWQNCQHGGAYRVRRGRKWTSKHHRR